MTRNNIEELEAWIRELEKEPDYLESESEEAVLPDNPTNKQLRAALVDTRAIIAQALKEGHSELEQTHRDMDKMRNHRHDFSKQFSGRAEH